MVWFHEPLPLAANRQDSLDACLGLGLPPPGAAEGASCLWGQVAGAGADPGPQQGCLQPCCFSGLSSWSLLVSYTCRSWTHSDMLCYFLYFPSIPVALNVKEMPALILLWHGAPLCKAATNKCEDCHLGQSSMTSKSLHSTILPEGTAGGKRLTNAAYPYAAGKPGIAIFKVQ